MTASQYVLQLLPSILTAVAAVENVKELKGQGARKKAVVMAAVTGAAATADAVPNSHVQAYSHAVDAIVAALFPDSVTGVAKE